MAVVKFPAESVEVPPSRSVSRSESIIISTSVPLPLDGLMVGLIVAELDVLLIALRGRGAEEEADETADATAAVFVKDLAVDAADVHLDRDEEGETVTFLRVV